MYRLKNEIVEQIQNDAVLFGKVANALGIKPSSLLNTLTANRAKLTQLGVLKVLREHLKVKDSELLCELEPA